MGGVSRGGEIGDNAVEDAADPAVFVACDADVAALRERAARLAAAAGLTVLASPARAAARSGALLLVVTTGGLELREAARPGARGVRANLAAAVAGGARPSRRQPLGRAMGAGARTVVDATAGLGRDSALLALMGFHVTAIERSPVLVALLRDGLERAAAVPGAAGLGERVRVVEGDAREVLAKLEAPPDVVYVDPMFPPRRKTSALAKRSIRLVRRLVGDDADAEGLFLAARRCARRVVVKRAHHAPPLAPAPAASIAGKLVRYDVYAGRPG